MPPSHIGADEDVDAAGFLEPERSNPIVDERGPRFSSPLLGRYQSLTATADRHVDCSRWAIGARSRERRLRS